MDTSAAIGQAPPSKNGGKSLSEIQRERAEWYEEVLPEIQETAEALREHAEYKDAPPVVRTAFRDAADELDTVIGKVVAKVSERHGSDVEMNALTRVLDLPNLEADNARKLVRTALHASD